MRLCIHDLLGHFLLDLCTYLCIDISLLFTTIHQDSFRVVFTSPNVIYCKFCGTLLAAINIDAINSNSSCE